jgi:hypothetical protein
MKTAKKLLALVLALVLAFSLVTMAGADAPSSIDDFVDFEDIGQKEAVDVLTALGILSGYAVGDGFEFRPEQNITRAEAAKIMAYVILGTASADALVPASTGFRDVPMDHWASSFVAFGVNRGILAGHGDGTFSPENQVTATQMAKMLLMAMGYGQHGEFTGGGWELNVIAIATHRDVRVLAGTGNPNFSEPATRQEVARYTFQALTAAPMVNWNAFLNTYVPWQGVGAAETTNPTLGENTFGLRANRSTQDAFGFNQRYWFRNVDSPNNRLTGNYRSGNVVDSFTVVPGTSRGTLFTNYTWQARWGDDTTNTIAYWLNGTEWSTRLPVSTFAIRGNIFQPGPDGTVPGTHFTLVDEDWDGTVDKVIATFEHLAQVVSVNAAAGTMNLNVWDTGSDTPTPRNGVFAEGFARDDYVLVIFNTVQDTVMGYDTATARFTHPISVVAADSFEAVYNGFTPGSGAWVNRPRTIRAGDTNYFLSATAMQSHGLAGTLVGIEPTNRTYTFWLDSNGNAIGYSTAAARARDMNYVFVLGTWGENNPGALRATVNVVSTDGGATGRFNLPTEMAPVAGVIPAISEEQAYFFGSGGAPQHRRLTQAPGPIGGISGWFSYTLGDNNLIYLTIPRANETFVPANGSTVALANPNQSLLATTPVNGIPFEIPTRASSTTEWIKVSHGRPVVARGFMNNTVANDGFTRNDGSTPPRGVLVIYDRPTGDPGATVAIVYHADVTAQVLPSYGIVVAARGVAGGAIEIDLLTLDTEANEDGIMRGILAVNPQPATLTTGSIVTFTPTATPNRYNVAHVLAENIGHQRVEHADPDQIGFNIGTFNYAPGGALFANSFGNVTGNAARPVTGTPPEWVRFAIARPDPLADPVVVAVVNFGRSLTPPYPPPTVVGGPSVILSTLNHGIVGFVESPATPTGIVANGNAQAVVTAGNLPRVEANPAFYTVSSASWTAGVSSNMFTTGTATYSITVTVSGGWWTFTAGTGFVPENFASFGATVRVVVAPGGNSVTFHFEYPITPAPTS